MFLDRDGVLNRALVRDGRPYAPRDVDELEILPDAPAALARLKHAGFKLIVISNQPEVARGGIQPAALERINQTLRAALPIDAIYTCCHDDSAGCECRKPKPGLLQRAATEHNIDLADSFVVGDRWRDVDAGAAAGCATVFLEYGYHDRTPAHKPDATVRSTGEAAAWIISRAGAGSR